MRPGDSSGGGGRETVDDLQRVGKRRHPARTQPFSSRSRTVLLIQRALGVISSISIGLLVKFVFESPSLRQVTTQIIDSIDIHNKTNQLRVTLRCALRAPCPLGTPSTALLPYKMGNTLQRQNDRAGPNLQRDQAGAGLGSSTPSRQGKTQIKRIHGEADDNTGTFPSKASTSTTRSRAKEQPFASSCCRSKRTVTRGARAFCTCSGR